MIPALNNYYKILGVSQTASLEAIRRAYREKAKSCHPDISAGKNSKEQFQILNEAYQVLKNDKKRRLYDYSLSRSFQRQKVYYNYDKRSYHKANYKQRPYYAYRANNPSQKSHKFEKTFDNILFMFMVLAGIYAVGFGFYRLYYEKIEGVNPIAGIISGTIFTLVIVVTWIIRTRK